MSTFPTFIHTDGTKCIYITNRWFVPLDTGGEGHDCELPHPGDAYKEIAADLADEIEAFREAFDVVNGNQILLRDERDKLLRENRRLATLLGRRMTPTEIRLALARGIESGEIEIPPEGTPMLSTEEVLVRLGWTGPRDEEDAFSPPVGTRWVDIHSDEWLVGTDGLMRSPGMHPSRPQHVEKTSGPLVPVSEVE